MSNYTAVVNNKLFFSTSLAVEQYSLSEAEIELEANTAGTFTFKIPPQNSAYGTFSKLTDVIDVYRDEELIFSGRPYSIKTEFDSQQEIECEGLLAYLNDSIIRPWEHNGTLLHLITQLLSQHNEQVNSAKQINVGNITVTGYDEACYRAFEKYDTTMSRLKDLIESYEGYVSIRKESDGLYLDWVDDFTTVSTQAIELGENLLDLTEESTSEGIITAIIPLGADIEQADGTKAPLTIKSVTSDKVDYIKASGDAIAKYGLIWGTNTWKDVTTPQQLYSKALAYMNATLNPGITATVKAADLHEAGYDVDFLNIGYKYIINSSAHGISKTTAVCTELKLNLLDPTDNEMEIGTTLPSYIKSQSSSLGKITETIGSINANYVTNETVNNIVENSVTELTETVISEITQNPDSIIAAVKSEITDSLGERVQTLESWLEENSDKLAYYISVDGEVQRWFEFTEDGLIIKRNDVSVYTQQDNEQYVFKDRDGNVLTTIDTNGLTARTANVSGQLKLIDESGNDMWAIRHGKYIDKRNGYNLDIVWLGGGIH